MGLVQLVYVSRAREDWSDDELEKILLSSVRYNIANGVTGLLLYSRGTFMQVIEGEAAVIDETYRRIVEDQRHYLVNTILREPLGERDFPAWHMAFRKMRASDVAAHPAYARFFEHGFDAGQLGARDGIALDMLKHFSNC